MHVHDLISACNGSGQRYKHISCTAQHVLYQRYKHISCTAQHVPTLQAHQLYCSAWTSHSFSEYRSQKSSFPAGLSFSDVRTRRLLADVLGLNGQGQFPSSPSGLGQLPCNKIYKAYRKSVLRENNPKNARRLTL